MKKVLLVVALLIGIVLFFFSLFISFKNTAVEYEENAKTKWSKVESAYQRRNDLIGNLVKTVQGAADFEKSTLTDVINARAKATAVTLNTGDLSAANLAKFQQAQQGLSGALSKLMVSVERYPDLKANRNFLELQSQLEGTENRISVARDRYNDDVNLFNKHLKKFPGSFWVGFTDFKEMDRYKADKGSEKARDVNFKF